MSAIHHTSFSVTSINGVLQVRWTNSDSSQVNETIDPGQDFANEADCQAWLNTYAKAYNDGKDQEWTDAHPTTDPSLLSMIGQTYQIT